MARTTGRWSAKADGTNAGATATIAGEAGKQQFVDRIAGHTDCDSIFQVLDGASVVWEMRIDCAAEGYGFNEAMCIPITPGNAASGKIVSSLEDCSVTLQGFLQ